MTVQSFLGFLVVGSGIASIFTQALKKAFPKVASNILVLVSAVIVGGVGLSAMYIIKSVQWSLSNIICIPLMIFAMWLGAMQGYDKVLQSIDQIKGI